MKASDNVSKMTGPKASQQSPPNTQTSSPSTAATNTSNAANAQASTVPPGINVFRDLNFPLWKREGDSGKGPVSDGIHCSAPTSQHQDQNHTHAIRTSDNKDRNDTARKLPQSLNSTFQHLPDMEASTSRGVTAAEHGEGFIRSETSGSGFPDPTDTDTNSLSQGRVNSREPASRTLPANGDEAIVEQAMRESFEVITEGPQSHRAIAKPLRKVISSIKRATPGNLERKFRSIAKTLNNIKKHIGRLFGPGKALPTAKGAKKRKISSASDTEEHGKPSKKKFRPSGATIAQEETARESDPEELEKLSHTYNDQIVIVNDDLGNATDQVRYSMDFYKDALVTDSQSTLRQIEDGLDGRSRDDDIDEIVQYIDAVVSFRVDVKLVWVKGHSLCTGNHVADRYANGGRFNSELGAPPIISMDDSASQAQQVEVRKYAGRLPELKCKKATRKKAIGDAKTQTEPLMYGAQDATTEAAHILQESSESDTSRADSSPGAEPNTTKTSMDTVVYPPHKGSNENEESNTATTSSQSLNTAQNGDGQHHVGATIALANIMLATPFESSSASHETGSVEDGSRNVSGNQTEEDQKPEAGAVWGFQYRDGGH
ncbi:hypothetical protein KC332_g6074 [Hortaea werneckii]|nr:hypothetical protein KC358_g5896 [Hortaea werneckii]KAI6841821.1 hypothetical protein KC350_g5177 [Hortaea werneckii]KAI6935621.1 hypothetical protein KC348_g6202 [Hortaea werneckii]KAI6937232.1 hypothetical protein KC341_g5712 [Hortaea werneckii]KAI6970047.1 hypothetical protein KC321_g7537 [Hortaea werneckii]